MRRVVGHERLPVRGPVRLLLGQCAWVDIEVAHAAPATAHRALDDGRAKDALELASEALSIIEQPLLAEFERGWLDACRRQLAELIAPLADVAVDAGLRLGGTALHRAEPMARRGVEQEPFRESTHASLMRVLAAKGDSAEALRVFDDLRIRLRDELGASPSRSLLELHQRLLTGELSPISAPTRDQRAILAHDPKLDLAATGEHGDLEQGSRHTGVRVTPQPSRIPVPPTPTIGRDDDLLRLRDVLKDPTARLVTVIGPGGVGKTRLEEP